MFVSRQGETVLLISQVFRRVLIPTSSPFQTKCHQTDTLQHRLTQCAEVAEIWKRTRHDVAELLLTGERCILSTWTILPDAATETERDITGHKSECQLCHTEQGCANGAGLYGLFPTRSMESQEIVTSR